MLDEWLDEFEAMRRDGAVVLVKWDGQRSADPYTFMISRHDTDFVFRRDTDDLPAAIAEGVARYRATHPEAAA